MDPVTYQFLTVEEQSFWNPVSFYDWEHDKNENKRNIKLLDSRLLPQIDKEITTIFRETT